MTRARLWSRWGIWILSLVLGAVGWTAPSSWAQVYPRWFLNQQAVQCRETAVGYAPVSFYPDSASAQAFRHGCETAVRQRRVHVVGKQAYWSTEGGAYWMGGIFRELYDTTSVSPSMASFSPLDTLVTEGLVAVLLGSSGCRLDASLRVRLQLKSLAPPTWIETPPNEAGYYHAVGVAPEYFYEASAWAEAEQLARRNLARTVYTEIKALQKVSGEGQEILHEEYAVTLRNVQVVARWRDLKQKIFYVLVRMPQP